MDVRDLISGRRSAPGSGAALGAPRLGRRHLIALGGALLLQSALLGPLVWSKLGGDALFEPASEEQQGWVLPLELTPRRPRPPVTSGASGPTAPNAPSLPFPSLPSPPASRVQAAPVRVDAPVPAAESAAPIDPRWRLAPPDGANAEAARRAPWGGDVCRDLSNFRAWQAANCRERGPPPRAELKGSPPAEIARPEPSRGRAPGETAQDQFAAQAAANAAWRDYTRGDGAYPGLRSLFSQH